MAITFGVMLHMDRAPAVAVAPPAPTPHPIIEATVVSEIVTPVPAADKSGSNQFNLGRKSGSPVVSFPTYDLRGEEHASGDVSGTRLDLFA
jgi:hypothetical protein